MWLVIVAFAFCAGQVQDADAQLQVLTPVFIRPLASGGARAASLTGSELIAGSRPTAQLLTRSGRTLGVYESEGVDYGYRLKMATLDGAWRAEDGLVLRIAGQGGVRDIPIDPTRISSRMLRQSLEFHYLDDPIGMTFTSNQVGLNMLNRGQVDAALAHFESLYKSLNGTQARQLELAIKYNYGRSQLEATRQLGYELDRPASQVFGALDRELANASATDVAVMNRLRLSRADVTLANQVLAERQAEATYRGFAEAVKKLDLEEAHDGFATLHRLVTTDPQVATRAAISRSRLKEDGGYLQTLTRSRLSGRLGDSTLTEAEARALTLKMNATAQLVAAL